MKKQIAIAASITAITTFLLLSDFDTNDSNLNQDPTVMMSGSWVHNPLECQNTIDVAELHEIQIGSNLPNNAVNAFRLDSPGYSQVSYDTVSPETVESINTLFANCDSQQLPNEEPVVGSFVSDTDEVLVLVYPIAELAVRVEKGTPVLLTGIDRIKQLVSAKG